MITGVDDDWYWLRAIYELLKNALTINPWIDIVLPVLAIVSTTAVAVVATRIAYESHKTAKRATDAADRSNELALQFREDERTERELARRREFAVQLRGWYSNERWSALFDERAPEGSTATYAELMKTADIAGDEVARSLTIWLSGKLNDARRMPEAEKEEFRTGARVMEFYGAYTQVITEWIEDPESVTRTIQHEARIAALQAFLAKKGEELAAQNEVAAD